MDTQYSSKIKLQGSRLDQEPVRTNILAYVRRLISKDDSLHQPTNRTQTNG